MSWRQKIPKFDTRTGLSPAVEALFEPRPPPPFLPFPEPPKYPSYGGIASLLDHFEDPKEAEEDVKKRGVCVPPRKNRILKKRKKAEEVLEKVESEVEAWRKVVAEEFGKADGWGDCEKTIIIARLSYETTELRLRRVFSKYGNIIRLTMVTNKLTGEPRGYAFIEYEKVSEAHDAYDHAHRKRIDGREIVIDMCRAGKDPEWVCRRLGGGKGATRSVRRGMELKKEKEELKRQARIRSMRGGRRYGGGGGGGRGRR
eukprot:TRINITY_DN314_c3_g1_i1.p1 TRINITY_DN314_c3_g1~~TRINITY_DN314_c3_g1_i1.p1  ORF type:complete len:257 (-),score=81.12 TRINITY_DN314_c3_g1_i1:311-1081(-)